MINQEEITDIEEKKIKAYDRINKKFWGMGDILPYYLDTLPPDKAYDLMQGLERVQEELKAEGEV